MKLTPDVLLYAPSHTNPDGDRELLLRGLKAPQIENLGVTRDINASINLTDNDILFLGNFPSLPHLKTLLISRNRICEIEENMASSLPNLQTLVLSSNNLSELSDLIPLRHFKKLIYITLLSNEVILKENYRLWLIWLIPSLRIIDFQKIKDIERKRSIELFGTWDLKTSLTNSILSIKSNINITTSIEKQYVTNTLTEDDKKKLLNDLQTATSLAEIEKIKLALKNGYF